MDDEGSFKTAVCSEYELLLHACKARSDECRRSFEENARGSGGNARRRRAFGEYEKAYAKLVHHFSHCKACRRSYTAGTNSAEKGTERAVRQPSSVIQFKRRSA
jgi:hypothetical protein